MSFILVLMHELLGICRFLLIDTHRVDQFSRDLHIESSSLILNELLQFTKYYNKENN